METVPIRMSQAGFNAFLATLSGPEVLTSHHDVSMFSCGQPFLDRWLKTRALIVCAVDAKAAEFWMRRGFIPSKGNPFVLYRSLADIAAFVHAATD